MITSEFSFRVRLRLAALVACLLLFSGQLRAAVMLMPPPEDVRAGERFEVMVYVDGTETAVQNTIPAVLLHGKDRTSIELKARFPVDQSKAGHDPGSFRLLGVYDAVMPKGWDGVVWLEAQGANRVVLSVVPPPPAEPAANAAQRSPAAQGSNAADERATVEVAKKDATWIQRILDSVSPYEPSFLAFDLGGERDARVQFSAKYRLIKPDSPWARRFRWADDVYFGYTQISLWDLRADSYPFHDSSYKPELFYRGEDLKIWDKTGERGGLGVQFGWQHESNGKSGTESRSIDLAYVQPLLRLGPGSGYHLSVEPRIFTYLDRSDNPDIAEYRGYVDLKATFGSPDDWQIAALLRYGSFAGTTTEIELSYPLDKLFTSLNGYLILQFFDGYGETILDYNVQESTRLRVGIMFLR